MYIISCDFHTRFQQIAMLDTETGEVVEKRLDHESGEAKRFYEGLKVPARYLLLFSWQACTPLLVCVGGMISAGLGKGSIRAAALLGQP
jgi:hypothetical protein